MGVRLMAAKSVSRMAKTAHCSLVMPADPPLLPPLPWPLMGWLS
jgi:hypothetical protein